MEQLRRPPQFHCFGHDHGSFGVTQSGGTTFVNSAQEALLQADRAACRRVKATRSRRSCHHDLLRFGGCALEFDVTTAGSGATDQDGNKDGGGAEAGGGGKNMRIMSME